MKVKRVAGIMAGLTLAAGDPGHPQQALRVDEAAIDTVLLREVTRELSHDSLRGRDTGSSGAAAAARYIVERLRTMGLRPAIPGGSYAHPVPMDARAVADSATLAVRAGSDSTTFAHGRDFFVLLPDSLETVELAGEPWFLGTGDEAADAIDPESVDGRVLVILGGFRERADSLMGVWAANGAAALMILVPDRAGFAAARRGFEPVRLAVPGIRPSRPGPPLPLVVSGEALAAALLEGASMPPRRAGEPRRVVRLPVTLSASLPVRRKPVDAVNVIGLVPGRDPDVRDELVVYTAHYDHVGVGEPDETGDSIYNGFSDNAAGVAMLLATADAMQRSPPDRSVLFAFLTGEERGLLGSSFLTMQPPWPGGLGAVRALINLDGGAPPRPPISWRFAGGLGREGSPTWLGVLADSIVEASGWTTGLERARPNSDYWPFSERGVPSIFIIPGNEWENTTTEQRDALRARWDRYHQPGDEYHDAFPFAGLRRYAALGLTIGRTIAAR